MTPGKSSSITFMLNGKKAEYPREITVSELLTEKELKAQMVVVEINGSIVARASFGEIILRSGDDVEIVHFVGGGK